MLACAIDRPSGREAQRVVVGGRDGGAVWALGDAEQVQLDLRRKELRRYRLLERTVVTRRLHGHLDHAAARVLGRLMAGQLLRADRAGAAHEEDVEQVLAEARLGVRAPGQRPTTLGPPAGRRSRLSRFFLGPGPDIEAQPDGGGTRFTARGRPLGWCSDRGRAPEHLQAYLHFLRHEHRVHPLLLDWVKARGAVPEEARFDGPNLRRPAKVVVRLEAGVTAPAPEEPRGFEAATGLDGSEPVDALLASPPPASPLPAWARLGQSRTLLSGPDPLGGFLVASELALEGAVTELPPELDALRQASTDARLHALMLDLDASSRNPQACRAALARLEVLRTERPAGAHVLAAFAAATHVALREDARAKPLLEEALAANPRLAGAWLDLGHLYRRANRQPRGWACWDRARALAPGHPLLQDLACLEASIEAAHPEWFSVA